MKKSYWNSIKTPAFVYDICVIEDALARARGLYPYPGYHVLYSLKACSVHPLLVLMAQQVDGFAVSSLFEAWLAREVLGDRGDLHFTSTILTKQEIGPISDTVDYLTFNSVPQLERFVNAAGDVTKRGLRINPQLSFVADDRYDPCRPHSKLGVPVEIAAKALGDKRFRANITGIHLHTNCDSCDLAELRLTVQRILPVLRAARGCLEWINLGGGYLFREAANTEAFAEVVSMLHREFGLDVFVEPGSAIVRDAGFLISSVVDLFESGGKEVAILDTTVSHAPEVFEFQYEPKVLGAREDGSHRYILAGCSCLAGDVFGEFAFDQPLSVGRRVAFGEMGAYMLVKAQMFNGINLPSVYLLSDAQELSLVREFTYEDFMTRYGVRAGVPV